MGNENKMLNRRALKAWILSKVITLTNSLLATEPGISAMDAAQGPVIQKQFDEINSKFAVVEFITSGTEYGEVQLNYPNGFAKGTCCVIGFIFKSSASNDWNWNTNSSVIEYGTTTIKIQAPPACIRFTDNKIIVTSGKYLKNLSCKLILMDIS